jgi:hypothetical protein
MCVGCIQTRLKLTDSQSALLHHRRYQYVSFFWKIAIQQIEIGVIILPGKSVVCLQSYICMI